MLTRTISKISFYVLLSSFGSCVEPYEPPTTKGNPDFLVVDGFVNVNDGSATVKIMHTVPLSSKSTPAPENGAIVSIEEESGSVYQLTNSAPGLYEVNQLNVDISKRHRLYIKTSAGREYQSAYINTKNTPEIDSITYFVDEFDELNINVNTHDPTGKSRFYRWQYVETWEYQSNYASGYVLRDGVVQQRTAEEDIYTCWRTDAETNLFVATTNNLTEDVVRNFTLVKISRGAFKIARKYSLLVKQSVLAEEAYDYWLSVQKTTEALGGLFDPMPSQVVGNIRSITDPEEEVIGFFSGGSVTEKRIFITPADLPDDFGDYRRPICDLDTIDIEDLPKVSDPDALIFPVYPAGFPVIIGYTTSDKHCIDCRQLANGTTTKPLFWE